MRWYFSRSDVTGQARRFGSVLPFERGFEEGDLVGRELEEMIDDVVDLALGGLDLGGEAPDRRAVLGEVRLPLAALAQRHLRPEGALHLGEEASEVELPPAFELARELAPLRRGEIEDAAA